MTGLWFSHLRGFSGSSVAGNDEDAVVADGTRDVLAHLRHRKSAAERVQLARRFRWRNLRESVVETTGRAANEVFRKD